MQGGSYRTVMMEGGRELVSCVGVWVYRSPRCRPTRSLGGGGMAGLGANFCRCGAAFAGVAVPSVADRRRT
jgi:hypothetical protein